MVEDEESLGGEPQDAAAEAFEQLRDEVAQLRGAVEGVAERLGERWPDYTPTLAAMAQSLDKIEAHPALRQTPEGLRSAIDGAVGAVRSGFETETRKALQSIGYASAEIQRHAGELRTRKAQTEAIVFAAGGGLIAGAVLWVLLSGPAARALPASWHVPERMAADTLHMEMWAAGGRLMQADSPQAWDRLVGVDRIARDNAAVLDRCTQAAVKAGKAQPCRVVISPTAQWR